MWHFGTLIANVDMHEGNLSFIPSADYEDGLRIAPAYDMLPMLYVPQRGIEMIARSYVPQLPLPSERRAWRAAAEAAQTFWSLAASDQRISEGFRVVCSQNLATLRVLAAHPAAA